MIIPYNQQLRQTWQIIAAYAYHDNRSVFDQQ